MSTARNSRWHAAESRGAPDRPASPAAGLRAGVAASAGHRRPRSLCGLLLICMCLTAVLTVPGCRGCRRETVAEKKQREAEEKKKREQEKKKRKPPFQAGRLRVQPFDDTAFVTQGKWGHWVSAIQAMQSNNANFQGELLSATVGINDDVPYELERTPFRLRMIRPVALPKEQIKYVESTYFVSRLPKREGKSVGLLMRLRGRRGGREVWQSKELPIPMPAHQYDIVVLSRRADSYAFLKRIDSVEAPWDDFALNPPGPYYRVLLPKITATTPVPLPSQPLMWTTIAYLIWDDIDPAALSLDQQQALLDWLHWGGQILISGPATLDALRGSFLGAYLPAESGSTVKLTQSSFDPLNERFTLAESLRGRSIRQPLTVTDGTHVEAIELKKLPQADYVPSTGDLLIERRVGRGRIVVTAFPLTDRRIINWRNFDNFFNACLLRRPPRQFAASPNEFGLRMTWAKPHSGQRLDARLVSNLRYFSRDMGKLVRRLPSGAATAPSEPAPQPVDEDPFGDAESPASGGDDPFGSDDQFVDAPEADAEPDISSPDPVSETSTYAWDFTSAPLFDNGFEASTQSGVAGWDDFNGTASEVREALKQAAGITVPSAAFVVKVLGVYLLVLVPLNWAFFRLIGRVEWAWLAAPVIAVGGAVAVVYLAQLDIGFVRSRTEIGLLEIQGDYHRAHLTRYTALYTSLSTSYDFSFDDPSALAQPFSKDPAYQRLIGQRVTEVLFARDPKVRLSGFPVGSNSTGMVHSEQMFPLGGGLRLTESAGGGWQLVNETNLTLQGTGLIRRVSVGGDRPIEVAWVGPLQPQARVAVRFEPARDNATLLPQWNDAPETAVLSEAKQLSVRRLLDLAQDPQRLSLGDVRLVAWTDVPLPGLDIRPRARQAFHRTLVVAHLRYGPLPDPQPDRNTRREVEVTDE